MQIPKYIYFLTSELFTDYGLIALSEHEESEALELPGAFPNQGWLIYKKWNLGESAQQVMKGLSIAESLDAKIKGADFFYFTIPVYPDQSIEGCIKEILVDLDRGPRITNAELISVKAFCLSLELPFAEKRIKERISTLVEPYKIAFEKTNLEQYELLLTRVDENVNEYSDSLTKKSQEDQCDNLNPERGAFFYFLKLGLLLDKPGYTECLAECTKFCTRFDLSKYLENFLLIIEKSALDKEHWDDWSRNDVDLHLLAKYLGKEYVCFTESQLTFIRKVRLDQILDKKSR